MENEILQFLALMGFIIFGVVRAYNKSKKVETETQTQHTTDGKDNKEEEYYVEEEQADEKTLVFPHMPRERIPADWKQTSRQAATAVIKKEIKPQTRLYADTLRSPGVSSEAVPSSQAPDSSEEAEQDFGIYSLEDARRGIIWSEILQRKY